MINTRFIVAPVDWMLAVKSIEDIPYASYRVNEFGELIVTHSEGTFSLDANEYVIHSATADESYSGAMANTWRILDTEGTIIFKGGSPINLTNDMIIAWEVDEGDDVVPLGAAVSSRFNLTLANANNEWLSGGSIRGSNALVGATVSILLGVYHSGDYDYEDIGTFVIEQASYTEGGAQITLIGSDALLYGLVGEFTDGQTYPRTVQQIFDYIVSQSGITLDTGFNSLACNTSISIPRMPKWGKGLIYRQALAYICAVGGSFLRVGRNGQYQVVPSHKPTSTHNLNTSQYMALTDDEKSFSFNRVKAQFSEKQTLSSAVDDGIAETASNTILVDANPLLTRVASSSYVKVSKDATLSPNRTYYILVNGAYVAEQDTNKSFSKGVYSWLYQRNSTFDDALVLSILNGLKTHFTGMTLRGMNIRWRGDPLLQTGDRVTLTDRRGIATSTCVFAQTLNYKQGFDATIKCTLDDDDAMPAAYYAAMGTASASGTGDPSIVVIPDGSLDYIKLSADAKKTIALSAYPVGGAYISYTSTSPATLFGGTWTAVSSAADIGGTNFYVWRRTA